LKAEVLDRAGVHHLEPNAKPNVCGGVFYPDDAHCNPQVMYQNLKTFLLKHKVTFLYNSKVIAATFSHGKVDSLKIENEEESIKIDHLVLAAGSWSGELAKALSLKIPMEAGKGYSFTQPQDSKNEILHPSILCEAKVAVTPFINNSVRFAGTMELSGLNQEINYKRVESIAESSRKFFPKNEIKMPEMKNVWLGLRPCSPDGLPYIGRDKGKANVVLATGHAMLGISMAAATGKIVTGILQEEKSIIDLDLFRANRFD
jgi:D-amino-acid dehydrogenase